MSDPEELVSELRGALAHLNDPAYLENHPLARRLDFVSRTPDLSRGQALRRALRLAIEALDPGTSFAPNSPEARPYQIARRYYISRQPMAKVATQLDITERHAYRELRRAIYALARILCDEELNLDEELEPLGERLPARASKVRAEVERLSKVDSEEVDIVQLLSAVVECARPLARDRGIEIQLAAEAAGAHVAVNRIMLRQALLNLLSHVVHVHEGGNLPVCLHRVEHEACIQVCYCARPLSDQPNPEEPYAVAAQLLNSLGVRWAKSDLDDRTTSIAIHIPLAQEHTVLIVDDNAGLIRLFRRYLRHEPYNVYAATNANEALQMLAQLWPNVVILDVMMPERDGWETLQLLRATEAGRRVRVIVCSIINDPQLSASLGADGFLHKPVDRASLLHALGRVLSPPT